MSFVRKQHTQQAKSKSNHRILRSKIIVRVLDAMPMLKTQKNINQHTHIHLSYKLLIYFYKTK